MRMPKSILRPICHVEQALVCVCTENAKRHQVASASRAGSALGFHIMPWHLTVLVLLWGVLAALLDS